MRSKTKIGDFNKMVEMIKKKARAKGSKTRKTRSSGREPRKSTTRADGPLGTLTVDMPKKSTILSTLNDWKSVIAICIATFGGGVWFSNVEKQIQDNEKYMCENTNLILVKMYQMNGIVPDKMVFLNNKCDPSRWEFLMESQSPIHVHP